MSAVHAALDDAVRAYNAAEDDDSVVTGWVLIAASTVRGDADSTATTYVVSEGTPVYAVLGLLDITRHYVRARLAPPMEDDE